MRVVIVGASGSVPGPASAASCYLVQAEDDAGRTWHVVLDLGSGATGSLQRFVDPLEIDAIGISHAHPDHCADLAPLDVYLSHHPDGPVSVPVYGPFGLAGRIAELRGADEVSDSLPTTAWQPGTPVRVGPMTIHCEAVLHPIPAYGIRIEGPSEKGGTAVLAYSGDTDDCPGLDDLARDADLLLCEASFLEREDKPRGMHLTGARAGQAAQRAEVRRLLLTHIPPWTEPYEAVAEAAAHYAGPLGAAHAGMRVYL